jgi:hypothetical protein
MYKGKDMVFGEVFSHPTGMGMKNHVWGIDMKAFREPACRQHELRMLRPWNPKMIKDTQITPHGMFLRLNHRSFVVEEASSLSGIRKADHSGGPRYPRNEGTTQQAL